jgi:hypothetical protein
METAPADLNCSWSERDASQTIVFSSSTAATADNFTRICFTDTTDNNNCNVTQPLTPDINSFYFYEVSCFVVSVTAVRMNEPFPLRV